MCVKVHNFHKLSRPGGSFLLHHHRQHLWTTKAAEVITAPVASSSLNNHNHQVIQQKEQQQQERHNIDLIVISLIRLLIANTRECSTVPLLCIFIQNTLIKSKFKESSLPHFSPYVTDHHLIMSPPCFCCSLSSPLHHRWKRSKVIVLSYSSGVTLPGTNLSSVYLAPSHIVVYPPDLERSVDMREISASNVDDIHSVVADSKALVTFIHW